MSLRLIQPGRLAVDLSNMRHPKTGEFLRPLFHTKNGRPVWPVLGAGPDDPDDPDFTGEGGEDDDADDEDEDDEDEDEDDDEEDKKNKKVKGKKKGKKDDEDDDEEEETYTKAQYEKMRNRMRAADRKSSDLEKRLKALENKGKPADEVKAQEDRERQERADKAESAARRLKLENAFLRSSDVDWIDPDDALRLVDLDEVDVDEDGTVDRKSLRSALRALAKAKPHLVKSKKAGGQTDDDQDDDEPSSRRSGSKMNGKRKGSKNVTNRDQLAKDFPILRMR
jgi:hypothetical protein